MYYGYLETFKILEGCYTHTDTHTHAHTRKKVPAIYDNDKKNIEIFVLAKFTEKLFLSSFKYEGVSINNQPIPFPMDRDGHDFHALFQYMFYT